MVNVLTPTDSPLALQAIQLCFSLAPPSGKHLTIFKNRGGCKQLQVIDTDIVQTVRTLHCGNCSEMHAWDAEGKLLAVHRMLDDSAARLHIFDVAAAQPEGEGEGVALQPVFFLPSQSGVHHLPLALSDDGTHVAYKVLNRTQIDDIRPGQLKTFVSGQCQVVFSSDGTKAVFSTKVKCVIADLISSTTIDHVRPEAMGSFRYVPFPIAFSPIQIFWLSSARLACCMCMTQPVGGKGA